LSAHHASFHPDGGEGAVDKAVVIEFAHDVAVDDLLQFDLADALICDLGSCLSIDLFT